LTLTPEEITFLLRLMNRGEGSNIRPNPSFTGSDALALVEKLERELEK